MKLYADVRTADMGDGSKRVQASIWIEGDGGPVRLSKVGRVVHDDDIERQIDARLRDALQTLQIEVKEMPSGIGSATVLT